MCDSGRGILRTRELRASGWSRRRVSEAVADGRLDRVRIGVYATPGCCAELRSVARHGGHAACVTAARHLGIWILADDSRPHVWMRDGERAHHDRTSGCRCVEHWDGRSAPPRGTPAAPRVLRQILSCFGVEAFFVSLESALRLRLIDATGMAWLARTTTDAAREAIAFARADADSGLESLFRWRLRHLDVEVRTQVDVAGVGLVDILIGERLIIETDGRVNHDGTSLRHKDLLRDAHAAEWGYVTLRFDYAMVMYDWPLVEGAVLGALAAGLHLRRG
ncbi:type IV toxin-antitoxin system AbiEi family antitoxin domain-containing protein [Microbacterium sp. 179-B 1A2 NHS]|uniref:type IV toxin-antitoxin system AbiEi family antitoxin domain-containing protein n=1 Tax=Microbacterium sp. 179-B 1A2 NHS TaxID=3142383 RepID=UPI0039A383EA